MARNSDALFDRLYAAAIRAISANNIGTVGKDGRHRVCMEWVDANGKLANLLREVGDIPMHDDKCASRLSPVALCNCPVMDRVREIEGGE